MRRCVVCLLLLLVGSCQFDRAGLATDDQRVASSETSGDQRAPTTDQVPVDQPAADLDLGPRDHALTDRATPDFATPDAKVVVPIDAAALGQAYVNAQVPCVDMQGNSNGTTIPVADSANVQFFDGALTLANASAALKTWVGVKTAATVMWDPNACDDEWPLSSGTTWTQAGLLIRGASLNSAGQLVLEPGLTTADIDVLDILADAGFEQEVFEPDDSGLAGHPPLVGPVTAAKQLILQLGYQ